MQYSFFVSICFCLLFLYSFSHLVAMPILIIEDNRFTAKTMQRCLHQAGYTEVTLLESAEDAFFEVYEQQYDLLLIDWMLPGVSGLEFTRHLRAHVLYEEVPIIMITAKGEKEDVQQAREAGVNDYMLKPNRGWQPRHCKELVRRINALQGRTQESNLSQSS